MTVRQALLSVSDKRGLVELAHALDAQGIRLLSTGGTAKALREAGLPVRDVAELTGMAEMLDGRVKTLHPHVHGGILARRDREEHVQTLVREGIEPIDLVVVNLYPFEATVAKPGTLLDEAIENIDIGGPAMVRAAAKNHGNEQGGVAIVTDPDDYEGLLLELREQENRLSLQTRRRLAVKAFTHTARYDSAIANYLSAQPAFTGHATPLDYPERLHLAFDKVDDLRYGENPHQNAAFYREAGPFGQTGLASAISLQGKALSYNNLADADAAWNCACSFSGFTGAVCVIVKHANPCGVALAASPLEAYRKAFSTDPTSAFGGIIAFNTEVDESTANAVSAQFLEVLIAPAYTEAALAVLKTKPNVRVLRCTEPTCAHAWDYKRIGGGLLVQSSDLAPLNEAELKVVTQRAPTEAEMQSLRFVWQVAQFVKSNAIVYGREAMTIGIGAGQMSRVDSARIARIKAEQAGFSLEGCVAASDAFFPFRDGLDVLAKAGATAVIQPGGSIRDPEVIQAANEQGLAMVFTGYRHFRH
jgi:phosphoribosylaminoimidazolecarboxamide formyltransferase / IMP cyclohydrolase